jgi:copper chaperone CopZ
MTCSHCVSSVESVLGRLPGVMRASVSLVTSLAEVIYNGNTTGGLFCMDRGAGGGKTALL